MDKNREIMLRKRIDKTIENLKKNNMEAFFAEDKQRACDKVRELLTAGEIVACGGSVSLEESGIMDILRSGDYNFLDNNVEGYSREQKNEIRRESLLCDSYLSSSNAITEDGVLYNVDGFSNRVAAIIFGPRSVIIVAGYNKIVKDLDEAITRVKRDSAPANCERLSCDTYCKQAGECLSLKTKSSAMTDGCRTDDRICANFVVCSKQKQKGRIKVIIVGEQLGY